MEMDGLYVYGSFLVFQLLKVLLQHKPAFTTSQTHSHTPSQVTPLERANLLIRNS